MAWSGHERIHSSIMEDEISLLIDLENKTAPNTVPLIVPRTLIVFLEDLIRTYLIDLVHEDAKRSIQKKLKKWDDELERICTISSNPHERKCSWGSIARWCSIVERHIGTHQPFLEAYQPLFGDKQSILSIFTATNHPTPLSTTLHDLAPIRNNLMHSCYKLRDKDPHSTILESCFGTVSIDEWWNHPIKNTSLINRMLHNVNIVRRTANL